jgi:hypothetical protein
MEQKIVRQLTNMMKGIAAGRHPKFQVESAWSGWSHEDFQQRENPLALFTFRVRFHMLHFAFPLVALDLSRRWCHVVLNENNRVKGSQQKLL